MSVDTETIVQVLMLQRDRLFAYVWTIVRDVQLVEDTLQELSILAVQKGREVENERNLIVWLRRAARLKSQEILRQRNRMPLTLDDATLDNLDAFWSKQDSVPASIGVQALRDCISRLAPTSRRILALRYFDCRKTAEVAQILGRKVAVIYTTLSRIHKVLRECVQATLESETR